MDDVLIPQWDDSRREDITLMGDALTLDAVTPDRLTEILRCKGHVARGRIERIAVESSRMTLISAIARLRLEWSIDAEERVPSRLFLKMSRPDQKPELAGGVLRSTTPWSR